MNKYITAILVALSANPTHAQLVQPAPKLVVSIAIDQLRSDYIEEFSSLYTTDGWKKLMRQGMVYDTASYPFEPVDRASAIACIMTGTTPYYNSIVGTQWMNRNTLRPVSCVDDDKFTSSPAQISTSTLADELKISTKGKAMIYAVAADCDAAILSAGHAADGAFWIQDKTGKLCTSTYYSNHASSWIKKQSNETLQSAHTESDKNALIVKAAIRCIQDHSMGKDDITDMMSVTLTAQEAKPTNWQTQTESAYLQLDNLLSELITSIETSVGKQNVLFVLTSTGFKDEENVEYGKYRIPTGTFYINRTANLLNIYLGAIYGQGRYVETCFHNQIYLNRKLIEQKRISFSDILSRSQEFLIQNAGVRDVFTTDRLQTGSNDIIKLRNGYNPTTSGDIMIEVAAGWRLLNEDSQESYTSRAFYVPFPIILYGAGIKAKHITAPVTIDRIAPTLAKAIRIRAPNACKAEPLP